jgi:hypothetical protein
MDEWIERDEKIRRKRSVKASRYREPAGQWSPMEKEAHAVQHGGSQEDLLERRYQTRYSTNTEEGRGGDRIHHPTDATRNGA